MAEVRAGSLSGTGNVSSEALEQVKDNVMLNAFRIAVNGSLTQFKMVDGIVDEYEDSSGVDLGSSSNFIFDEVLNQLIHPSGGNQADILLHFDGDDGDNFTTDAIGTHTLLFNDNAKISTTKSKFGGSSLALDGNNDYLIVTPTSTFAPETNIFTLDLWINFNSVPTNQQDVLNHHIATGNFWRLNWAPNRWEFQWETPSGGNVGINAPFTVISNTWYHVAVIRGWNGNPNDYALTVDGVVKGTTTSGAILYAISGGTMYIGRAQIPGFDVDGYIDEFRFVVGTAAWTAPFSPPTSAYNLTRDNMTLISKSFTAVNQPDSARIVLFEEDIDSITENTDLIASISRDGGVTYSTITLEDNGDYELGKRVLAGTVDISGQPAGTSMIYKIETQNNKDLNLHGVGLSWN